MRHSYLMTQIVISIVTLQQKKETLEIAYNLADDIVDKANIELRIQATERFIQKAKDRRHRLFLIQVAEIWNPPLQQQSILMNNWQLRFGYHHDDTLWWMTFNSLG